MKITHAITCSALIFSTFAANASVVIQLENRTDSSNQAVTFCDQISQTILLGGKLKVMSNGCSFSVTKKVSEEAGYTLGELQKLILDYSKNDNYEVRIVPLVKDEVISIGVNTIAKK